MANLSKLIKEVKEKITGGHETEDQKNARIAKQNALEQSEKQRKIDLDRLNTCLLNFEHPKAFERLLLLVDSKFMADPDFQEKLKVIVEKSNKAQNQEVNACVLFYIEKAVRTTMSPKVLKNCYELCGLDLNTKKELGKDMNKPENLKAIDIIDNGLVKYNTKESYDYGYQKMSESSKLSDTAHGKFINFAEKRMHFREIRKI